MARAIERKEEREMGGKEDIYFYLDVYGFHQSSHSISG
jgi:hypothetical protein